MKFVFVRGMRGATVTYDGEQLVGQFDWGYNGSGPTDLAKAVLDTFFTYVYAEGNRDTFPDARRLFVDRYMIRFREEVLSAIASNQFDLTLDQITAWIQAVDHLADQYAKDSAVSEGTA